MKILHLDSQLLAQYAMQSMAQLLAQQVPVFIKSYGINSLATLNFRGSSSAQSQVLWNGVPLNNASLGMADVSLLSVQNFDQVNIVYGGSSALLGSGNVGAALLLDNQFSSANTKQKWQTNIAAEAGSFGQYKLALKEQYSAKKLFVSIKAMGQSAKNNFSYSDLQGNKKEMSNAGLKAYSGMLNLGYRINDKTQMNFSAWYQYFDREIPPALFEPFSVKQQKDASLRILAELKRTTRHNAKLYNKIAFLQDVMQYNDDAVRLSSVNKTFQLYEEMGWKKVINKQHEWLLFLPVNISWTTPQNDSQTRFQNKIGLAAAYTFSSRDSKLKMSANARVEQINKQCVFLSGVNAAYALFPFLSLRANIQKSYRAPTLNEWYYQPGGNPGLKPEQGWSEDFGYELKLPIAKNIVFQHDASLFNRNINDWILWFGGSIWTPHNIAKVHSRGLETINSLVWKKGNWIASIRVNTSFVLATTQQSYISGDGSIGKQIPYAPRYNGQANFSLGFRSLYFNYNHTYTGYRFVTVDESQFLLPYNTGNVFISYKKNWNRLNATFSLQCNNIWNESYQVVNLRPMPGRNAALGCSILL